jgi:hypothetical protein
MAPDPLLDRMFTLHVLNTCAHVAAGSMALAAAAVPLLSRKGGRLHRIGGWAFAVPGALVVGSAALSVLVFPQPGPLVAATLSAAYQYMSGMRSLRRFRPGPNGPNGLDAAMAIFGLLCAAWIAALMGRGLGSWNPRIGYPTLGFSATIMIYDLSRHLWRTAWRRSVRPLDHGLKMTGASFAMLSAGLGNLLPHLKPWSSLGPSLVVLPVMALLTVSYLRGGRRSRMTRSGADADPTLVPT